MSAHSRCSLHPGQNRCRAKRATSGLRQYAEKDVRFRSTTESTTPALKPIPVFTMALLMQRSSCGQTRHAPSCSAPLRSRDGRWACSSWLVAKPSLRPAGLGPRRSRVPPWPPPRRTRASRAQIAGNASRSACSTSTWISVSRASGPAHPKRSHLRENAKQTRLQTRRRVATRGTRVHGRTPWRRRGRLPNACVHAH